MIRWIGAWLKKFSSITDKHLLNMIQLEGYSRTGAKMTVQGNAAVPNNPGQAETTEGSALAYPSC
ncbi:TPA: hypothetical protein U8209_000825 [Pseudomonas putida]|nr:hypothetical protein [Pseudomonas putida]